MVASVGIVGRGNAGRLGRGLISGDTGMGGRGESGVRVRGKAGGVARPAGRVADFCGECREIYILGNKIPVITKNQCVFLAI